MYICTKLSVIQNNYNITNSHWKCLKILEHPYLHSYSQAFFLFIKILTISVCGHVCVCVKERKKMVLNHGFDLYPLINIDIRLSLHVLIVDFLSSFRKYVIQYFAHFYFWYVGILYFLYEYSVREKLLGFFFQMFAA